MIEAYRQRISKMAEITLETTTEIDAISSSGCTLITELPEIIMINIFGYLKGAELDLCSRVCTQWRDIIDNIMHRQVTTFTRRIPLSVIKNAINVNDSEKLRRYVGFEDHFQYIWFVLEDEHEYGPRTLSTYLNKFGEITYTFISYHKYLNFMEKVYRVNRTCSFFRDYRLSSIAKIQISMFPNIPGVNIINHSLDRFIFRSEFYELTDFMKKIKKEYRKINIRHVRKKCVIIYEDFALRKMIDKKVHYPIDTDTYMFTIFHGERVNAFALRIDVSEIIPTIKKKLERLKYSKPRMVQKRCFLYIFNNGYVQSTDKEIRAIKEVFPLINYVAVNVLPLYISVAGDVDYFRRKIDLEIDPLFDIMVFVWWE
ncbi:uncharacterized protein LOC111612894 isoform X1 [Centruroides sculpturatus]|uniref:uncharacterized protein LOC111612894 isoform X1 n=2 Tax=Centruroides sculpturatus TaxID=218467 RepID=UPI000C6DF694|nr:uncharacterized protein LOC111612894 isoform X1 [Centruroides sculpturatus]